jgi:hypothetical protein
MYGLEWVKSAQLNGGRCPRKNHLAPDLVTLDVNLGVTMIIIYNSLFPKKRFRNIVVAGKNLDHFND